MDVLNRMLTRDISRKLNVDRKTVTRLINAYEAHIKSNPESGIDEFLAITPKYKSRAYTPRVVRDSVTKEIDKWLVSIRRSAYCSLALAGLPLQKIELL